jgi:phospholipase/lecithinase/hemolysin
VKRNRRNGLFSGFWLDMGGKRIRAIRQDEYGMLYHLYRKGTEFGLTDAAGARVPNGPASPSHRPALREHLSMAEANPFHGEMA